MSLRNDSTAISTPAEVGVAPPTACMLEERDGMFEGGAELAGGRKGGPCRAWLPPSPEAAEAGPASAQVITASVNNQSSNTQKILVVHVCVCDWLCVCACACGCACVRDCVCVC